MDRLGMWSIMFGAGDNKVDSARATMHKLATQHDPNDSECIFWAGDFAGVNLRAVCPVCADGDNL